MLQYRASAKHARRMNSHDKRTKKPCPFCDTTQIVEIVSESKTMRVIRNRVPYDMFEGALVVDHLMVTPKQHRTAFAQFTDEEKIDYLSVVADYEGEDYNVYTRSVGSQTRSVAHLHTHLLKVPGRRVKFLLYFSKPYMLIHEKRFKRTKSI